MYPKGEFATTSGASRRRRHPALCDHGRTPVLVSAVPGGWQAQCLVCGALGPGREASEAAWSEPRDRGSSR